MSRFYSIDAANELLADLAAVASRLHDQRAELIGLRDAYRTRVGALVGRTPAADGPTLDEADPDDPELRRLRLRMRGLVDQMQAEVVWLDERSIVLRDLATGLMDFPALVAGRQVWLCWRLGESEVGWWHELDAGFSGRRPLADLA